MVTTLPMVGHAVSGASRRRLYRHSKRVLTRLLGRRHDRRGSEGPTVGGNHRPRRDTCWTFANAMDQLR